MTWQKKPEVGTFIVLDGKRHVITHVDPTVSRYKGPGCEVGVTGWSIGTMEWKPGKKSHATFSTILALAALGDPYEAARYPWLE